MKEYGICNRTADDSKEITEDEALSITKSADLHAGSYGYMGHDIGKVLYGQEDDDIRILAVHYKNEWLSTPDNQDAFMGLELSHSSFEE